MSDIIGFATISYQGRLTSDPETKVLDSGSTLCKFTVAVNRRIPGGGEHTSFIPTVVFGNEAVNCAKFLTKGRIVLVTGEFQTDKYEDRNGVSRTGFECRAYNVIFGSGGAKTEESKEFDDFDISKNKRVEKYLKGGRGR